MRFRSLIIIGLVIAAGPVDAKCAKSTNVDADCYEGGGKDSAYARLGRQHLKAKNFAAAVDAFTRAIALDPSATANYNNRANAYSNVRAFDKAIADYTTAIRLARSDRDRDVSLTQRATTLAQMGDYAGARADLRAALAINPKSALANRYLALAHYMAGDYREAADLFTGLLRQNPRDGELLVMSARAFREMDQLDKALTDLQCAQLAANDPACFATRADVHARKNDLKKAWADVEAALRLNSKSALAFRVRADLKAAQGEDLAAVLDYTKAIESDRTYVLAYLKRGDVLMQMGRSLDALKDYDAAAGLSPNNALELEYRRVAAEKAAAYRKEVLVAAANRTVMVFFDYGMTDIIPSADQLLELVSKVLLAGHAVSAEIVGHVDAVEFKESPDIAMGRAYAVRTALVRRGIPVANLTAVAGSQSDMLVPTQDREPQNRRVVITFRK